MYMKLNVIVLVLMLSFAGCSSHESAKTTPTRARPQKVKQSKRVQRQQEAKPIERSSREKWYVGGNLHAKKMSDWYKATYDNRLATAADFVSVYYQRQGKRFRSIQHMREEAKNLVICITEAGRGGVADTQDIADIGAMCFVLMNQ